MKPTEQSTFYQFNFGNITIADSAEEKIAEITNLTVDDAEFDEDAMYAGVRLSWESDSETSNYEIYRINQDNSKSLLGYPIRNVSISIHCPAQMKQISLNLKWYL